VAKELGFQLVVFDDVLEEKSNDLTHDHQAYIKRSIEQGIEIPAELAVNLLSEEIDNAKKNGMTGTLVCGFPETTPYRIGFQEKVSMSSFSRAPLTLIDPKHELHALLAKLSGGFSSA
jgi:hypothetical protein